MKRYNIIQNITKHIPKRSYNSLVTTINYDKTINSIQIDEPTNRKPFKEIDSILKSHRIIRKLGIPLILPQISRDRLVKLREYLGEEYRLNDELLINIIYNHQPNMYIEIENDGMKLQMDTKSIREFGYNLFNLQTSIFLLNLAKSNTQFVENNIDINDHKIWKFLKSKQVLNSYLSSQNFQNFIVQPGNSKKSLRESFFKLIGILSYQYGNEKTSKFLLDHVIKGESGLEGISIQKLQ
ncbi:hypothetical protein WICMUC_005003 [Wickerhamomyces mucosus]|uniref:RNase III domain-containing protein n=1 Tax=Wickerhamomyces mucosus TaxID=1378264 RepID=A0A9P8PDA3_9ASCO|nr:hypothetical protein WICMUC_005003 [Wickerhamomyces mucosus]